MSIRGILTKNVDAANKDKDGHFWLVPFCLKFTSMLVLFIMITIEYTEHPPCLP
jgi:hypothetical protein